MAAWAKPFASAAAVTGSDHWTDMSMTLLACVGLSCAGATLSFFSMIRLAMVTLMSSFVPFAHSFLASGCWSNFSVLTTRCATRWLAMMSACVLTYVACGCAVIPPPPAPLAATGSDLLSMTMEAVAVYCFGQMKLANATKNTTARNITPDLDAIISEIDIAAPPELIFKAICDAETVRRRCPGLDVFEMDLRVGGHWCLEIRNAKPRRGCSVTRHDGEILELEAPRLLVYTWFANFHEDPRSRSVVRWDLTPTESGTHVKVTHSGLASEPAARADYAGGWPGVLEEIKTYAEK